MLTVLMCRVLVFFLSSKSKGGQSRGSAVLDYILSLIHLSPDLDACEVSHCWAALTVLPHLR